MLRLAMVLAIGCGCLSGRAWGDVVQHVVVVLDDSGSMSDPMRSGRRVAKMDAAKRALLEVLSQLPEDAQVGVLALNTRTASGPWIIPLGPLDQAQVRQAIGNIQAAGGTLLGVAMKQAADALLAQREKQQYGEYRLLIVTDGEAQDEYLVDAYLPEILRRQITVDVIGVSMAQDHSLANSVNRYRRADDPASLQQAIEASLAETPLDPQDPDEASDFELLNGLSEPLAVAAIKALSQTDNRPIGTSATEDELEPWADSSTASGSPAAAPPGGGGPSGAHPRPNPKPGVSKFTIFVIIVLIMVVLKSLARAGGLRRS
jgi:uncharacterized protein YegL